ncbi:unnamed protein product [Schistosoma turkestanicum]|nr:unnamed protein product [Schistosoma turkestanicum]
MQNQLRILFHFGYDHNKLLFKSLQLNHILIRWKTICPKLSLDNNTTTTTTTISSSSPQWDILHSQSVYDPTLVENPNLCKSLWDRLQLFNPDNNTLMLNNDKSIISMILPPPNVTGSLHVGHALTCAIQDAIARCYRMQGKAVVWVPGMDHAGIATQSVVERDLLKKYSLNSSQLPTDQSNSSVLNSQFSNPRLLLGRENFVQRVWDWKDQHAKLIREQLDSLGLCLDWSREFFTLSPNHCECVTEAFLRLYNAGLIYRAESFVSWCCYLQTAISDIEVELRNVSGSTFLNVPGYDKPIEFGVMDYFAYPVIDAPKSSSSLSEHHHFDSRMNEIVVATTRLETMLADVALVVHPDDKRYQHLIGCYVEHPFCPDKRRLPIIADSQLVQPEMGTGVVKLSPGHSQVDWEVARRHQLPVKQVFDNSGCITSTGSEFDGLPRFIARQRLIERLSNLGLYKCRKNVEVNGGSTVLPICSRSGDLIEPMIRKQWFIRIKDLADAALEAVHSNQLELFPANQKLIWSEWLDPKNHKDWCISRQLWWGHPIPAYKMISSNSESTDDNEDRWIVAHSLNEAVNILTNSGLHSNDYQLIPDPDVLDTWFSSSLLPFSIFGWPNHTKEARFYPLRLLESGQDILFFWIARMVMLGIFLTGQIPFKTVILHGLVCDSAGQKMSKSKNNVVNPLNIIHGIGNLPKETTGSSIQVLGADALRAALLTLQLSQHHVNFDENVVLEMRKFCNKMWQTARFVLIQLQKQDVFQSISTAHHKSLSNQWIDYVGELSKEKKLRLFDIWIIHRLYRLIQLINTSWIDPRDIDSDGDKFHAANHKSPISIDHEHSMWSFHHGVKGMQTWWMNDLCSIYLEVIKNQVSTSSNTNSFHILYLCVMTGIHLFHPIMPHITEVLWHGLNSSMVQKKEELLCNPETSLLMQPFPQCKWFEFLYRDDHGISLDRVEQLMSELTTVASNVNSWRPLLKFINHHMSTTSPAELKKAKSDSVHLIKNISNSTVSDDESAVLKALTSINLKSDMLKSDNYVYIPVYNNQTDWYLCINKTAYDLDWARNELQLQIDKSYKRKEDLASILMKQSTKNKEELNRSKIEVIERKIEKLEYQLSCLK